MARWSAFISCSAPIRGLPAEVVGCGRETNHKQPPHRDLQGVEGKVDGSAGALSAGGHEVRVHPQCQRRVGVPQVLADGLDALPSIQNGRVEVPQSVHAVLASRLVLAIRPGVRDETSHREGGGSAARWATARLRRWP